MSAPNNSLSNPWLARACAQVSGLAPYVPGKPLDELERELGIQGAIKLASNENPLGPSPAALHVLREHAANVHLYPDGNGFKLKQALAQSLNVAIAGSLCLYETLRQRRYC